MLCNVCRIASLALLSVFFHSAAHAESKEELGVRLISACYRGNAVEAVRLLREGADANFTAAAANRSILFTSNTGGIINASDWTPVIALSDPYNLRLVAATAKDAENESPGRAEAHEAVPDDCLCQSRINILYVLSSHGANLDYQPRFGGTALHHAAESRRLCLAAHLVKLGAAVDIATGFGINEPGNRLALHKAAWSEELREILIKAGAPDDLPDASGMTPRQLREELIRSKELFESGPGDEPLPMDLFDPPAVPGAEGIVPEPEGVKRSEGPEEKL